MKLSEFLATHVTDYSNPQSFASKLRQKRLAPLVDLVKSAHRERGKVEILDIGGTRNYWRILPDSFFEEFGVTVNVLNLPDDWSDTSDRSGYFRFLRGNGCDMPEFPDGSFDIVHSNSVLEHVGTWNDMKMFAAEVRRVGRGYFIQTPNFWFPMDPHALTLFLHWLPDPVKLRMTTSRTMGNWPRCEGIDNGMLRVESARLLNKPMFRFLFPDADHLTEKLFLMPKSLVAVRRA